MSGFWLFVLVCGIIAAVEMIFLQWWDMRQPVNQHGFKKDPKDQQLTLKDLLIGIGLACCPIVNFLVAGGCAIYIFCEVAPKIVIMGPKS